MTNVYMEGQYLKAVVKSAREKFGDVMKVAIKEKAKHGYFYFVACKRDNAPLADRPYMSITAKFSLEERDHGEVSFFWGHYDLNVEQVFTEIKQAEERVA